MVWLRERLPADAIICNGAGNFTIWIHRYYRFRKPNYPTDQRAAMVDRIQQHLGAGRDVFAYFKHEETPEGAIYARELLGAFGGKSF